MWFLVKKHKTNLDGIDKKKITSSTISKDNLGRYWISINYKYDIPLSISGFNKPIGIDLGIKSLLVDSDGNSIGNPNTTKKHEKALRKAQRSLSKKKKGSKNRALWVILKSQNLTRVIREDPLPPN